MNDLLIARVYRTQDQLEHMTYVFKEKSLELQECLKTLECCIPNKDYERLARKSFEIERKALAQIADIYRELDEFKKRK